MKIKNKVLITVIFVTLIVCGLAHYLSNNKQESITTENKVSNDLILTNDYEKYERLNDKYQKISNDYVGIISFESGIIEYPFVVPTKSIETYNLYDNHGKIITDYENGCETGECTLNDVYLRTSFERNSYNLGGSIFMDYRNNIDDQNIIIYGHHFSEKDDPTRKLYFTPLELLLDEQNYQDNKYVKLYLENEIRRYELFAVYKFDITSDDDYNNLQYFRTNYEYDYYGNDDIGYYKSYIDKVNEVKEYKTDIELTENDSTLTLQTCIGTGNKYIQIVLFKEIERINY